MIIGVLVGEFIPAFPEFLQKFEYAMVFVWSHLTKGNPAYTVIQVATNDLIILIAFIPIVKFLLGLNDVIVPWNTLILSVAVAIAIFGTTSPVALATIVGVLVEVPVMFMLVKFAL